MGPLLGVAVTTHNRSETFLATMRSLRRYTPTEFPIVVIDDGSVRPAPVPATIPRVRHEQARGIPAAKNAALAWLMDAGCRHLFLLDDDTRPVTEHWWEAYTDGPDNHYQYSWTELASTGQLLPGMTVLHRDPTVVVYSASMGCMLYVTRGVVDRVGGFNPAFGMGMEEHGEWSQRIHNAGLTRFVHQDVPGASDLWYAADEHGDVIRSYTGWQTRLPGNQQLRVALADSDEFIPFR